MKTNLIDTRFVTFTEPDSMTDCMDGGLTVYDNVLSEEIEVNIKLPWSQVSLSLSLSLSL